MARDPHLGVRVIAREEVVRRLGPAVLTKRSRALSALGMMVALIAVLTTGCATLWPTASATDAGRLEGQWIGWMMIERLGNGPATMTVRNDGVFDGVLRLADGERAFRGGISVLGSRTMRYDGTFGDGTATVTGGAGERTLRLVPDGGGGVATFVQAK